MNEVGHDASPPGTRAWAPKHPHRSLYRSLRDKGVRFLLETCRSLYDFARKRRHLPPDAENPFSGLPLDRMKIPGAKTIIVFDAATERAFLRAAGPWAFPTHLTPAKTGLPR